MASCPRTRQPTARRTNRRSSSRWRAHRWKALIESGRYRGVGELARAVGLDHSYVARLLNLTLLAPDIAQAILDGREPSGLSLEKLKSFPLEWGEQRDVL